MMISGSGVCGVLQPSSLKAMPGIEVNPSFAMNNDDRVLQVLDLKID